MRRLLKFLTALSLLLCVAVAFVAYLVVVVQFVSAISGASAMAAVYGAAAVFVMLWAGRSRGFLLTRHEKRKWRRRSGLCTECGYDLRATPVRCPECGAVTGPASSGETGDRVRGGSGV